MQHRPAVDAELRRPSWRTRPSTRCATTATVFAGQRAEGFYVDLGSIFDLADLRPFQNRCRSSRRRWASGRSRASTRRSCVNVHSIALQVPIEKITASNRPVIGVWTTASRRRVGIFGEAGERPSHSGPCQQVSRLGNPLINEVIIPMSKKDYWNGQPPREDKQFSGRYAHPELAGLLPVLYPGVFPNLAAYTQGARRPRGDPADRHPGGRGVAVVHHLHRRDAGRHAPAQHVDRAEPQPEYPRRARRRRGRLPQRPPGLRRRRHRRTAGDRRSRRFRWSTAATRRTRRPARSPTGSLPAR